MYRPSGAGEKAYFRLLGTAISAKLINHIALGLVENLNISYGDVSGTPNYYVLGMVDAAFDEDHIAVQDGITKVSGAQNTFPNVLTNFNKITDDVNQNIVVIASTTESNDPIEIPNNNTEVVVKAALANDTEGLTGGSVLHSRNVKLLGDFDLTDSDLTHYKNGKFIAENATLKFGTSLPQTDSEFTNSTVIYSDGATITQNVTSINGCLQFNNVTITGKIILGRSDN